MKTIYLIRHANAKTFEGIQDIDRPLNRKGYEQAYKMSGEIASGVSGKVIIASSPSVRTYSTAGIFADRLGISRSSIIQDDSLYNSDIKNYLDFITSIETPIETLLLCGHNPTISELISHFSGGPSHDVSPGTVAVLNFECSDWQGVKKSPAVIKAIFSPKIWFPDRENYEGK